MGEFIRSGTKIRDFWPDDTATKIYKDADMLFDLGNLQEVIKEKWPTAELKDIQIRAEHIHTHALGYPRYDPSDYTTFVVIEYVAPNPRELEGRL